MYEDLACSAHVVRLHRLLRSSKPFSSIMRPGSSPGISTALKKSGNLGRAKSAGSPKVSGRLSESSGLPPFPPPPPAISNFPQPPPPPSPCWPQHLAKHLDDTSTSPLLLHQTCSPESLVAACGRAERLGVSPAPAPGRLPLRARCWHRCSGVEEDPIAELPSTPCASEWDAQSAAASLFASFLHLQTGVYFGSAADLQMVQNSLCSSRCYCARSYERCSSQMVSLNFEAGRTIQHEHKQQECHNLTQDYCNPRIPSAVQR